MRLVDDDGERILLSRGADLVQDELELVDRGNDDLFAVLQSLPEFAGRRRPRDRAGHLHELFDGVLDLLVQVHPVGHDDDGIDYGFAVVLFQPDQLMRQPRDGVGFPASRAVLDQEFLPDAVFERVGEERTHYRELMEPREYLFFLFPLGLFVDVDHDLGIILDDVRQRTFCQDFFPQVIGLDAVRIRRIARAVVIPLVERQEPRILALQLRAEPHLGVVHCQMDHAAFECEEQFTRIAVLLILAHGVRHVLLGQLVFELAGDDRQAVDEDAQVQRQLHVVIGIRQLTSHAEDIPVEKFRRFFVLRGRGHIEQNELGGVDGNAFPQHVDDAAFGDLALQPVKELLAFDLAGLDLEFLHFLRLRIVQEPEKPRCIHGVFPVVIRIGPLFVTVPVAKPIHDQRLKTVFLDVGRHELNSRNINPTATLQSGSGNCYLTRTELFFMFIPFICSFDNFIQRGLILFGD